MKILVAYYSRTGNTEKVAKALAAELGTEAALEKITEARNRDGLFGFLGAGMDATFQRSTPIEPPRTDLAAYDLVVVGTPVWNAHMSTPVLAYLKKQSGRLPRTAFFMTCFGRYKRTFETMGAVAGKTPLATMAVLNHELARGKHRAKVREFVAKIMA